MSFTAEEKPAMKDKRKNGRNNICCIINPGAARKKWLKKKHLREYLKKELPGEVYDIFGGKENTIALAKKLGREKKIIVALGGDGTIADVLQGLLEAEKEKDLLFGIVPLGSGNAFRKSLKIPKNTGKAVRVLHECETLEMDLFRIEGYAAGFGSIGFTAGVTGEKLRHPIQGLWGHLLAVRNYVSEKPAEREVELFEGIEDDGTPFAYKKMKIRFLDCILGKTNYFGYGWRVAPRAKLQDGYIDITFLDLHSLKFLLIFPLIYSGIFQRTQKHFKVKRMIIRGKNLPIQYNGEYLGERDTVEVEVIPRAIKVICPAARSKNR